MTKKQARRGALMQRLKAKKVLKVEELIAGKIDPDAVVPYSVQLPAPLYERLRKLNYDTRRPMSEFVIRGIEMVLKAEKH